MVRRLNPKRVKMGLAAGTLRWTNVTRSLPETWRGKKVSDFQRKRLATAAAVAVAYLMGDTTVDAMARSMGVTHQRVCQIIKLGTSVLFAAKRIREKAPATTGEEATSAD